MLEDLGALLEVTSTGTRADAAWVDYVARIWPLAHRYRILLVLRRSEHSDDIHAQLEPVERLLTDLVRRGQEEGIFGRHLPAATLAQLGQSMVFTLAVSAASPQGSGSTPSIVCTVFTNDDVSYALSET